MALTREAIVQALRELGVTEGMVLMVHSSLSALGQVDGGADTVIQALAEAVGPTGTLCMPAMASQQPFRVESSPSTVGIITEKFRAWPGVKRSIHPTHSVSCLGPLADEIMRGHIDQPTALGPDCPWARIAAMDNGYVLLLGCDQDRCTLLHCAEEAVDAAYLKPIVREYVDEQGNVQTKVLDKFPGPHRDFIGLNPALRGAEVLKTGKVGRATASLMPARGLLETAIAQLRRDPAAVLCDNPNCSDCVTQRAAIKRRRLQQEDFTLSMLLDELTTSPDMLPEALKVVAEQAVEAVELGPAFSGAMGAMAEDQIERLRDEIAQAGIRVSMVSAGVGMDIVESIRRAMGLAQTVGARRVKLPIAALDMGVDAGEITDLSKEAAGLGLELVVENQVGTACDTREACEAFFAAHPGVQLAFNPAHFAQTGEHPFLYTLYRGKLKHRVTQLYIADGCHPGGPIFTLPGYGNGELKELMSILRCRGFDGVFCLKMGDRAGKDEFVRQVQAFWRLMDNL